MSSPVVGVEETFVLGPGEDDILSLALKRVSEGLRLKARSAAFETFFAKVSEKSSPQKSKTKVLGTMADVYMIPEGSVRVKDATVEVFSDQIMIEDYIPNLSFLRCVGLKDGVAFTIPCVISIPQVESFGKAAQRAAEALYETYLRPYERHTRLYVRTERVA